MDTDYCQDCIYATHDYYEYHGGYRQWFIDGCRKETEPHFDKENECITCDEFKRVDID